MRDDEQAIPENTEGKLTDIEKSVIEKMVGNAAHTFNTACSRLVAPDYWHDMPGFTGASFALQKAHANTLTNAEVGDYISIDIPGPGPRSGDGKYWVIVEYFEDNFDTEADESCGMSVRASVNPNDEKQQGTAAHFFKDRATSTFIVRRYNNKVKASYHGRNEIPNTGHTGVRDGVRNALVSFAAIAGLSEIQWSLFLNGLLNNP
jgi:hypothetical protein